MEVNVESDATLLKNRKVRPSAEFIRNIAENGFQDSFANQVRGSEIFQSWFRQVSKHFENSDMYLLHWFVAMKVVIQNWTI